MLGGLAESERLEATLEIGHVSGPVKDADLASALLDFALEDAHGMFVSALDEDGTLAIGAAVDAGEHGFHLFHLLAEQEFQGMGAVGAEEGHEQLESADIGLGVVGLAGLLRQNGLKHQTQDRFPPFFLQPKESVGIEVGVDEVWTAVIDGFELELEAQHAFHADLELAQWVVGPDLGGHVHLGVADHFIEQGVALLELFLHFS